MPSPFYDTITVPGVKILDGNSDGRDIDEGFKQLALTIPRAITPKLSVSASGAQSVPNNSLSYLTFDSTEAANGPDHPTFDNPTDIITIQDQGVYLISARVEWASNATGYRQIVVIGSLLGQIRETRNAVNGASTQVTLCTMAVLEEGASVAVQVLQNSGGALSTVAGTCRLDLFRMHGA